MQFSVFRRSRMLVFALAVLAICVTLGSANIAQAHPTVFLPYEASGYLYKVVSHGADPGFQSPSYSTQTFQQGSAAFGTGGGCPLDSTIKTAWASDTDVLVRRNIQLRSAVTGLTVHIAIDNDAVVYWNGTQIGQTIHDGCAQRDTLIAAIPDALVHAGKNLLAVRGIDRGSLTYLDMQVQQG